MNLDETRDLGWSWQLWNDAVTRGATVTHFANLTRGVACAPRTALLCRIQSTQCEAGQWERVLQSVPDEMIARAALGQFIVVHDRSEKPRETRAMWQGLTLAKITMELRWFGELRSRYAIQRGGNSSLQYLKNVASELPKHVTARLDYYRDLAYASGTTTVTLGSCWSYASDDGCAYGGRSTRTASLVG